MHRRFWPWAVLTRVHPPRHHGCTGYLIGLDEAIGSGLMSVGDIPTLHDAINDAAGVMMEGAAEQLLAELEVREQLIARGVSVGQLARIPWLGEGFDPSEPRGPGGRWIHAAAWDLIGFDGTRESIYKGEELGLPARGVVRVVGGRTHYETVGNEGGSRVRLSRFGAAPRYVHPDTRLEVVPVEHVGKAAADSSPKVLPWVDPPSPEGRAGERKGGGMTAVGITNTKLGDVVEHALAEHLGFEDAHPGKRQGPFDLRMGDNAYEVKAVSSSASEYKAKPKKHEVDGKLAHAKEHGLNPHVMIVVYDAKGREILAYVKPGVGAYRLTGPDQGWSFVGRVPLDLGPNPDPVSLGDAIAEAFDAAEHPRGWHGRFRKVGEIAKALARGEPSSVRPEDVPALIEHLHSGERSSLHQLQVEGHPNLFRANARDLPREQMPQIPKEHLPGFMDFLREHRVMATVERAAPSSLRATQNQINGAAVAAIAKGWDPQKGGILMVSREGDVLDGHHRWAGAALHEMTNPGHGIDVLRFTADTDRMLQLMREYNASVGVSARKFGEGKLPIGATG